MYQKLMTKELWDRTPPLYSQEHIKDPIVYVKFFTPWTNWTWYALEGDPKEHLFFGWVVGQEKELGYFSLDELESVKGPFGLKIERDMHFGPKPLSWVKEGKEHATYKMPKDVTRRPRTRVHTSGVSPSRTRRKPMYGVMGGIR